MGKKDKRERKQKGKRQNPFDNEGKKRKGRGKGKTKQDKNWDKYFKEFQDFLQPKGIFMRDVEGDGNCLFRSIADFIDGDEKDHEKYRKMAVEYIAKNKEYFAMFLPDDEKIEEYIDDMNEDGTWGGHFELVAISTLLNVRFCLHIKDQAPVIVKSSEKDLRGMKMVHLAYHVDEHYSSVRQIGDDTKEPADPIKLEVKDDDGDSSDSEGDSTEGSEKGVSSITKEVEKLHLNDKKNKNKGKNGKYEEEEYKSSKHDREDDYRNKKNQKNKDKNKEKDKNEDKGKGNKKKGR